MAFLDILTGRSKLRKPAPERLFALSTAYVALQSEHDVVSTGAAAIVFQPLATHDFESIVSDMEQIVRATATDSATAVTTSDDPYGFRWMVLRGGGVEDLVVAVNAVSSALETGGYGERVLCAVFSFREPNLPAPAEALPPSPDKSTPRGSPTATAERPVYLLYNYKRGLWYPFVPAPGRAQERDTEHELQLKAQIGSELPIEPELVRWFPLWGTPL